MKPWNERRPSGPLPGSPQDGWVHRSGMAPMAQWPQLEEAIPLVAGPMRRYLAQIDTVLRPGSVKNTDQALRSFGTFLIEHHREVTRLGEVTRSHIEDYKPWLAARPGRQARASTATLAHRLGTLRMFVRIDQWGWQEAPIKVPMFPGDLPRQDQQRSQPPGRTPLRPAMTSPQSPGGSATPAQDAALGLVIYADRMGTYLAAAHGDPARVRRMYVWDRDLSSALLADIAIVEVALRNAMHKALAATGGHAGTRHQP